MNVVGKRGIAVVLTSLVVVGAVVLTVAALGGATHKVRAPFASAAGVFPGLEVRIAGQRIGEVGDASRAEGGAVVELLISDQAWPLRRGTSAAIRFGTTTSVAARFVELEPGPRGAPALPEDGLLRRSDTQTPVEFDQFFDMLDRDARDHLKGLVSGGARALDGRAGPLARALDDAPGGLEAAASVMKELGADPRWLTTLIRSGSRSAAAIRARDTELRELLDAAAATFDELAARADPTRDSLERLPATLESARAMLGRAETSLTAVDGLVRDLAPGARRLREVAPPATEALVALNEVGPLAQRTLDRGALLAPDLQELLTRATPFLGRVRDVSRQGADALQCIRPWGPELAGLLSTWSDFAKNYDANGHYMRVAIVPATPFPNAVPLRPGDVSGKLPGVSSFLPRPPGLNADEPWFQPQCGAGPESLDPANDPEASP